MNLSTIRQQIASKISTIPLCKETKQTPDYFRRTQDSIAHRAFVVSLGSSTAMEERQRRSVGVYINTPVKVIFAYRLRPLDVYPTDYDLSLDTEQEVIQKVLESYNSQEFTIRYIGSSRQVTDSQEYIIITIDFETLHTI